MARTLKNTVDYFPHDAHASTESATLAVLEGQYNNDGYAFWFKLLEKLASTDGHFLDWSDPRRLQVFCGKIHITENQGVEMLNLLVEMKAIDKQLWETNRIIWCQNLVDNLAEVYHNRRREIPLKPFSTPIKLITTGRNPITTPEIAISTDERKREETKGNEIKEESSSLSIEDILALYKKMVGLREEESLDEVIEDDIKKTVNIFSAPWVRDAINEAMSRHRRNWSYVAWTLSNWKRYGRANNKNQDANKYTRGKYGHLVHTGIESLQSKDRAKEEHGEAKDING
ncbi:MAG: Lin1244/Lin1753 domain-containing protein [Dehalococcoidia bacterium]